MTLFSDFLKLRTVKMKSFAVVTSFVGIFLIPYLLIQTWKSYNEKLVTFVKQDWNMTLQHIVVHYDLKGAPPLLSYLRSTLQPLKDRGATALLIEYEDMFPYEGVLVNLSARNHYDRHELKRFLMSVHQIGLEIIPLVPTFGHLEFALKLEEFQHLREHPKLPDSICPSKKESQEFLKEMLRQVISFHRKVAPLKHIHVGCNEVHQIKVCEICSKKKSSKTSIILEHFKFINDVLGDLSPKTKILVWDDMLRNMHVEKYDDVKFPNVESVAWEYNTNLKFISKSFESALNHHQSMFGNLWVAAAYKGADGSTNTIPILKNRFVNLISLLNFIITYDSCSKKYNFKGIILTGRSRYSHMEPPCDLLPAAFPSLVLNLILLQKYHNGIGLVGFDQTDTKKYEDIKQSYLSYYIVDDFTSVLRCQYTFVNGDLDTFQPLTCVFEGVDLHIALSSYEPLKYLLTQAFHSTDDDNFISKGSRIDVIKLGYTKMQPLAELLEKHSTLLNEVNVFEGEVVATMIPYFDKYVIEEYVAFKLRKLKEILNYSIKLLTECYTVKDWPRRYSNSLRSASLQNEIDMRQRHSHPFTPASRQNVVKI